ncbi:hypothetical protein Tcan_08161 [Toxocara canis]|uniref:Uncharacterized protein n=2 Tax=Toxocara canis TaxID=6265 RepID=A0A0B2VSH3_TOXCA|nr:hypothetical protein Tcan_08161 [Toxocara canis]VDM50490.1 unnamed protein product [Toxocara canis]
MHRLRARRRRLLRKIRRKEEQRRSQSWSDESSSSCGSSLGTTSAVNVTVARPSVGTAYDVARHDDSRKNAKNREEPQTESIMKDAVDIMENREAAASAKRCKYGVDRTTTQIPEPSEEGTGTTRDANAKT